MERLSGDYVKGYTKAIQDIAEIFEYVQGDLNLHNKRWSEKLIMQLFTVILENREKIREKLDGFIRFNTKLNKFEYFKNK